MDTLWPYDDSPLEDECFDMDHAPPTKMQVA